MLAKAQAQKDSGSHSRILKGVTVTGNRHQTEDNLINVKQVAMPVTIIDKKTIAMMGSRRLDEVLREQTGMAVVSDLGAGNRSIGLQMQGFSSEYITVLINGQPMAGRNNGNFDLSRISVSDIERIEVIKGASSSLYGSEALGGVINIITRQNITKTQAFVNLLYGTFNTVDATLETETPFANKKASAYLSGNYYRTDGFNVNPYLQEGTTAPPYNAFTFQGRAKYKLNQVSTLNFTGRMAGRRSVMTRDYGSMPTRDVLHEDDANAMLALDNRFTNRFRLLARYYYTHYTSEQEVTRIANSALLQQNNFKEQIHRTEIQTSSSFLQETLSLITGAGGEYQQTNAATKGTDGSMYNYFGYAQANWKPSHQWNLLAGLRYDGNNLYGGKLNPSAGIGYVPTEWISFKLAVGKGFKSPTYRQLYQVFTNLTQGYTVAGANIFKEGIKELQASGAIQQLWPEADAIKDLAPETSTSWNLGLSAKPVRALELTLNGFYNNIYNMIITQQVGIKKNGAQLFSWRNVAQTYTKGIEAGIRWQPFETLTISGGYQLLFIQEKEVLDSIKAGKGKYATVREPSNIRASASSDYFGLPNRSRHMANLQVFYEYKPWHINISVRASYRSKYGFMDQDNNGFIDQYDIFVKGYTLLNTSVQKKILKERLTLHFTVDNINDYTDYLMPAQPGRMILCGATWRCFEKEKK